MRFNDYLADTFRFNDVTNRKLLDKIRHMPQPDEAVKLFSHLVQSQDKWMARLEQRPEAPAMSWWEPVYPLEELEAQWNRSVGSWMQYVENSSEEFLLTETTFIGHDGTKWAARPVDIALQLNYHSIHHRAQIQTLLRAQGIEPDFVDYIGTRYRKLPPGN